VNPYATLGIDANAVIVESQFETAREEAGLQYERFAPVFERDAAEYPLRVGLLIETASLNGPVVSETQWLDDTALAAFIKVLSAGLDLSYQLVAWQGFDFEIQGDAQQHLEVLKAALEARRVPPTLVSYVRVHDLSAYSSRIEGIGIEKPYYSPYIAKKKDDEGWFPENVVPVVVYQPDGDADPIAVPASQGDIERLKESITSARAAGNSTVKVPWLPRPLPLAEALAITQTFDKVFEDVQKGTFNPSERSAAKPERTTRRKSLLLRTNIESLDYEERRREALQAVPEEPQVPKAIRKEYPLLPTPASGLSLDAASIRPKIGLPSPRRCAGRRHGPGQDVPALGAHGMVSGARSEH
jgi:hypothetical protein